MGAWEGGGSMGRGWHHGKGGWHHGKGEGGWEHGKGWEHGEGVGAWNLPCSVAALVGDMHWW